MFDADEIAGGLVVGVLAIAMKLTAPRVALVPIGFAGGIVVGLAANRRTPAFGTALDGARAGVLGAVVYAGGAVVIEGLRLLNLLPAGFVVDWVVFQAFAVVIMLVPLYAIEGVVSAPVTKWLTELVREEVDAARTR